MIAPLEGVFVPVVTPFGDGGALDPDAFRRHLDRLLSAGVHGIVPCGTTGESYALSPAEQREVLELVAAHVGSRARLMAGASAPSTAGVIALGRQARELGYEAIMTTPPPIARPGREELVAHFEAVDAALEMPVVVYNNPPRTGFDLDPEALASLAHLPRLFALKESCGDLTRLHRLVLDSADRWPIACGSDSQAVEYFLWGSRAWIAGPSNVLAEESVAVWQRAVGDGDPAGAARLMKAILPVILEMETNGRFVQTVKYGCELAGVPVGLGRRPLGELPVEAKERFRSIWETARRDFEELVARSRPLLD